MILFCFAPFSLSGCLKMFHFLAQLILKRERERERERESWGGTMEWRSSSKWNSLQRDKKAAAIAVVVAVVVVVTVVAAVVATFYDSENKWGMVQRILLQVSTKCPFVLFSALNIFKRGSR